MALLFVRVNQNGADVVYSNDAASLLLKSLCPKKQMKDLSGLVCALKCLMPLPGQSPPSNDLFATLSRVSVLETLKTVKPRTMKFENCDLQSDDISPFTFV